MVRVYVREREREKEREKGSKGKRVSKRERGLIVSE